MADNIISVRANYMCDDYKKDGTKQLFYVNLIF